MSYVAQTLPCLAYFLSFIVCRLAADSGNSLTIPILVGNPTTYSHDPSKPVEDFPHAVGANTVLVGGLQVGTHAYSLDAAIRQCMFSQAFYPVMSIHALLTSPFTYLTVTGP